MSTYYVADAILSALCVLSNLVLIITFIILWGRCDFYMWYTGKESKQKYEQVRQNLPKVTVWGRGGSGVQIHVSGSKDQYITFSPKPAILNLWYRMVFIN